MKNWRSWILPTGFFGWCNQCSPNVVEFGQIACLPFDLHFKITFDKVHRNNFSTEIQIFANFAG
jgi:hypothetical protein